MSGFALPPFFVLFATLCIGFSLMSVNVYFGRCAQVFTLKLGSVGFQDVRILSGDVAGAVGPASLWVGAGLRANFWATRQRQAVFLRGHYHRHQVHTRISGAWNQEVVILKGSQSPNWPLQGNRLVAAPRLESGREQGAETKSCGQVGKFPEAFSLYHCWLYTIQYRKSQKHTFRFI